MTREEVKRKIAGDPEAERITSKHNDFIIDKVFDYFEQRIAELETLEQCIKLLTDERANMQKTHQQTINSYRNRITELEAPKTCDGCKWLTMDKMERIMVHRFHGCFVCSRRCKDNYEPKEV